MQCLYTYLILPHNITFCQIEKNYKGRMRPPGGRAVLSSLHALPKWLAAEHEAKSSDFSSSGGRACLNAFTT